MPGNDADLARQRIDRRVAALLAPKPVTPDVEERLALDETERLAVRSEAIAILNMTPDDAEQWVQTTFQGRMSAGDTQVQAALFVLKRIARLMLPVLRAHYRRNADGDTSLSQGGSPRF